MVDFNPAECALFVDACNKKFSAEDIFRFLIGSDENGCPYIKTRQVSINPALLTTHSFLSTAGSLADDVAGFYASIPGAQITFENVVRVEGTDKFLYFASYYLPA